MSKKVYKYTEEQAINILIEKCPNLDLSLVKYTKAGNHVLVKDLYGVCKVKFNHLIVGTIPTIQSAINKEEYFINQARVVHGDLYDYSLLKYTRALSKVTITCFLHGHFEQTPGNHLAGRGCKKCANEFLKQNSQQFANGWSHTNWEKAGMKSKNFDSYKVYIIKCWSEEESFYKIGKTFKTIKGRYRCKKTLPYIYTVVKVIEGESKDMSKLENQLKKQNKDFRYTPKIKFRGMYECFTQLGNIETSFG